MFRNSKQTSARWEHGRSSWSFIKRTFSYLILLMSSTSNWAFDWLAVFRILWLPMAARGFKAKDGTHVERVPSVYSRKRLRVSLHYLSHHSSTWRLKAVCQPAVISSLYCHQLVTVANITVPLLTCTVSFRPYKCSQVVTIKAASYRQNAICSD